LALAADPAERLTIARVRSYVSHLAETNAPQSVASQIDPGGRAPGMGCRGDPKRRGLNSEWPGRQGQSERRRPPVDRRVSGSDDRRRSGRRGAPQRRNRGRRIGHRDERGQRHKGCRRIGGAIAPSYPRVSNDTPSEDAFRCVAPGVRLSDLAIFANGVF
jgi:hypothetical protein